MKLTYDLYIDSPAWRKFKKDKAKECPKRCRACDSEKGIHLHHMIYRNPIESGLLKDTCWLCGRCHKKFHNLAGLVLKNIPYDRLEHETVRIITTGRLKP